MDKLYCVLAVLAVVSGLYAFAHFKPPSWREKVSTPWRRVNLWSATGALTVGLVASLGYGFLPLLPHLATAVSTAALTFATVQSCFTDPAARLVDRHTLYLTALVGLVAHGVVFWQTGGGMLLTLWLIFLFITGALILLPLVGPSDGRAFFLATAAAFPPLGLHAFVWTLLGFVVAAVGYTFVRAWRESRGKPGFGSFAKSFLRKASVPAVPFILVPYALALPLLGFITP